MTSINLTIELPDALARDAQRAGLLTSRSIVNLLSAELKRQQIEQLFATADQLADQAAPVMSAAEIEAEIEAARMERRQRSARGD
ncbi:MAG: hypothetical protein IAE81_01730 [Caldilineaceae bacterium]|mgnify:CR=1 FL=1|jgi:hypothetical protein|nr:hypothetical protein [Caldilineaceae bacterium]